ncbi:MAG: aminoglycoside 6-adenylyltransferase [Anaerolineaceae bacterium]
MSTYVAKGLWRGEITYAKFMLDEIMRTQLMKLLTWYIGMQTGFRCNPGKQGKYFQQYLSAKEWEMLLQTYADVDHEHNWAALFSMAEIFRSIALQVAEHFALEYPDEEYVPVLKYLKEIKQHIYEKRSSI